MIMADRSVATVSPGFEALLGDAGSQLLSAPLEAIDAVITDVLSRLLLCLGVERSTVRLIDPISGALRVTHSVSRPGVKAVPLGFSKREFPWLDRCIQETRKPIIFSQRSELPPEAAADLETARAHGQKSAAVFPIAVGSQLLGCLSFATVEREHVWSPATIDRLRLITQVFAGALLRLEHQRKLEASVAEVECLRDRLQAENDYLRERTVNAEGFEEIVGESPGLRGVLFQAEHVAPTDATVLLQGETGTGKELVAKAIHAKSHRRDKPLVTVNCAALPPTLIESELFGHEKGAFTGAATRKIGRFELADHGTLFLDEVGELPLDLQAKLLRVLQEGEFERLGSSLTHKVDVRVIAASNRDLVTAARQGTFRSDLYYRLGVFPIQLPPLRMRRADIPLLVWHILGQLGVTLRRKIERVPASTMDRLVQYDWPGNIREMKNVLERAVILSPGSTLMLDDLADAKTAAVATVGVEGVSENLEAVERDHILRVLDTCEWRVRGVGHAAERLGLNASTLYSRMKKLGIRRSTSHLRHSAAGSIG